MKTSMTRIGLRSLVCVSFLIGGCGSDEGSDGTPVPWSGPSTPTPFSATPTQTPTPGLTGTPTATVDPASPTEDGTTPPTPSEPAPCVQEAPASIIRAIPEDHACLHFEDGPIREVEASLVPEDAPDVSRVHTRFDVSLIPYEGGFGGWVRYTNETEGFYTLFSGTDVPVTLYGPDLKPLCTPIERAPRSCDAFMETMYVSEWLDFPIYVELGPGEAPMAQLAFEDVEVDSLTP